MIELIKLMQEADNFYSLGGTDAGQIEEAEKQLGLVLADDYKTYIITFGAATFDGHELTGICKSDRLSVISTTKRARSFYRHFPEDKYVIEELQFDNILTVQDSTGNIYSYGPEDEGKQIASSLQQYLFPKSTLTGPLNEE